MRFLVILANIQNAHTNKAEKRGSSSHWPACRAARRLASHRAVRRLASHNMAPKGKRKGSPCALTSETGASYEMMARCSDESTFRTTKNLRDLAARVTPYGPILKHTVFESVDGSPLRLCYACPFAFLYYSCASTPYFSFLVATLGARLLGRLVFYLDETKPGNVLRPNAARAMIGIFWGIADLPDWWRAKTAFWFVFAHVPTITMRRIKGGASAVFLRILQVFWSSEGHNMERLGVRVRRRVLRFRYGFAIVDEKAEKEIFGLKGAGGCACARAA